MDVRELLHSTTPDERQRIADAAETSVNYLWLLAGRHRNPSIKLCRKLIAADSRLTLADLRPDLTAAVNDLTPRRYRGPDRRRKAA